MTILLFGKDSFRSHRHLQELTHTSRQKGEDIVMFDDETFDILSLSHHLRTQGLFAKEKLIVLKQVISILKEKDKAALLELNHHLPPRTTLIFYEQTAPEKRDEFFKQLIACSKINGKQYYPEYTSPTKNQLSKWILEECKKAQKQMDPEATAYLIETYSDGWYFSHELDKLMNTPFVRITKEVVNAITSAQQFENNIFVLLDSLAERNPARALHLLKRQEESGAEPLYLLAMIARHIKILLKIQSFVKTSPLLSPAEIASRLSEHPFVIQKLYPLIRNFRFSDLIALYEKILMVDVQLKSTRIDPFTLLSTLVYDIIGASYDQRKPKIIANGSRGESR